MGKTNIEYTDQVSNPLRARPVGDESFKVGTFCEKPDAEGTCKNCWAETLNLRYGNKLAFDKANRNQIEWIKREKEMNRLLMLNKQKPLSGRNPGKPLMVFCCDTFDIFQPSITDELRDWVFDNYDECTNLTLQIQTTYPARMNRYFVKRYGENALPSHYWIGMSAGNQPFFDRHIENLLSVKSSVHYVIFEPLLGSVKIPDHAFNGYCGHPCDDYFEYGSCECTNRGQWMPTINWIIVGGESGNAPRICNLEWIASIVHQCSLANVPVLVKQMGAFAVTENANLYTFSESVKFSDWGTSFASAQIKFKHTKGGDWREFPRELRYREFPK